MASDNHIQLFRFRTQSAGLLTVLLRIIMSNSDDLQEDLNSEIESDKKQMNINTDKFDAHGEISLNFTCTVIS